MRSSILLVSLALGAHAAPLVAQGPAEVTTIMAWRDSLATMPSEEFRPALQSARGARSPTERLRLGWLLLAQGIRTDSTTAMARAADQFYEVTVRQPRWVLGWYGLGEAKRALELHGAREIRSPHQLAGTGWVWGGVRAYLTALQIDSSFAPALTGLGQLAPKLTSQAQFEMAWAAMKVAVTSDSSQPGVWLYLANSAVQKGRFEEALGALDAGMRLADAPRGAFLLERARVLFALGRPAAAESAYYAGAGIDDSLGIVRYRQEVAYVANHGELAEWDSTAIGEREAYLREFWGKRERASGRPAGSRLIEHNRRRSYAVAHFSPIQSWTRQYDFNMEQRDTLADLDDRGMVYVRHGEPDLTAGLVGGMDPPVAPNASWLYFRPEGNLLFHFIGSGYSGWHITTSLNDLAQSKYGASPEVYASRMGLDPRYGMVALRLEQDSMLQESATKVGGVGGASNYVPRAMDFAYMIDRERVDRRADIDRGFSTDSDPLRFDRELEPIVQVFGTGARDPRKGQLLVVVSIPASDRMQAIPLPDGGTGYLVRLRVTSADDSGHTTLDVDSLIRLRSPRPLARGQHLSFVRTFDLPATGDQRVRLILTDSSRAFGAVRVVNGVPLPPLTPDSLVITDLVVGRLGTGAVWHRPDGSEIALNPLNAWTPSESMEIGFELGGVDPGAPYKVRIAISDIDADSSRPPRASVEFEHEASGGRDLVTQSLGLQALRPGKYLLSVTVTAGDRSIRRERRVVIKRPTR